MGQATSAEVSASDSAGASGALRQAFRAIVFDWDGTAVADRHEDTTALAGLAEALLRRGTWLVVVTGTNFANIDRQLCRRIVPGARRHLLVCANRGSEVYGFTRRGQPVRRVVRMATPAEDRALTAIAEGVRDALVTRTGLEIRIVYDRLNRRKIDLIPLPEWADPPKARIGALLAAVEARLKGAGLTGGLAEAVALAVGEAATRGLPEARITSDVKHLEIGLTDKGDSLAWVKANLLAHEDIPMSRVLIAGDEFGPVAGFAGSDDRLRAGADGAVVVSVGAEPNGVPAGVLCLGGGPETFRALLADQLCLPHESGDKTRRALAPHTTEHGGVAWAAGVLAPPNDPRWRLDEPGYQPALEHEVESRFTIGNGFLGVRGSLDVPTSASRPRTYVAGLFDPAADGPALPALVPGPDWTGLRLVAFGSPLSVEPGASVAIERTLDLRRGVLLSRSRQRDREGRAVELRTLRCVSLADRRLALQVAQIAVERAGPLDLESWLAPAAGLERLAAEPPPVAGEDGRGAKLSLALWRTRRSGRRLAIAAATRLRTDGRVRRPESADGTCRRWRWRATPDRPATVSRLVAFARDGAEDPATSALGSLDRAGRTGLPRLLAAHTRAWAERWAAGDVEVEGDERAQRALRFAVYHLIGAANPEDETASIGARALTGDAYRGHVFWDTEAFLLPFYALTWPAAARALLMYRYRSLPAARAKAARLGYRGALYAWESADTGEEATPPYAVGPDGRQIAIRCGVEEQHISADIAHAVWQYWQATGDTGFLRAAGVEILLETARFWASRAALEGDGRYHIRAVIGPDEYHEGVDDNAYTNVMAQWNLERGLEVAGLVERRWPAEWAALRERLAIGPAELALWREVAGRMTTGMDATSGIFEQFAGYFGLEPLDLAAYTPRAAPMDVLLGRERTRHSQVIKQADVVMLLALLWDRLRPEVRAANFGYYEPHCGHGSSLSPPVHALVAARLGQVRLAERYFLEAAEIDLSDMMGNAAAGVHIGALGGLWQAAVFGFGGLQLRPDGLRFDPHLPDRWRALRFAVQWRGRRVRIQLDAASRTLRAALERGRPLGLQVGDRAHVLRAGEPWDCRWGGRSPIGSEVLA
jgi:trehalose/maltose hydrolase-like predicted phosphorylase